MTPSDDDQSSHQVAVTLGRIEAVTDEVRRGLSDLTSVVRDMQRLDSERHSLLAAQVADLTARLAAIETERRARPGWATVTTVIVAIVGAVVSLVLGIVMFFK